MEIRDYLQETKEMATPGVNNWQQFREVFVSRHYDLMEGFIKTHLRSLGSWAILQEAVERQDWPQVAEKILTAFPPRDYL